jgi:serine/threonine protein kinase
MDEFLPSCLQFEPDQRPTFQQLIETLRQNVELTLKYENSVDEIGSIFVNASNSVSADKPDDDQASSSVYGPIRSGGYADPHPAGSPAETGTQYGAISADFQTEKNRKSARMSGTLTSKAITKMIDSELNDSIKVLSKLGEGSCGTVYLCSAGSRYVALKRLSVANSPSLSPQAAKKLRKAIYKEASLMTSIRPHKNVIQMLGLRFDGDTAGIIMEFAARGSLHAFISKHRDLLSEALLFRFAIGVARGMQSLSSQSVVHRDLACRNVLLDSTLEPKISDFGLARAMESTPDFGKTQSNSGPIRWMAPECFNELKYSEKSDVWSFGCLLLELVTGRVPYSSMDTLDVYSRVKDGKLSPATSKEDASEMSNSPEYISELIRSCCKYDPAKRPSFAEIVEFLLEHVPRSVEKSERRREKRRIKREKLLEALSEVAL